MSSIKEKFFNSRLLNELDSLYKSVVLGDLPIRFSKRCMQKWIDRGHLSQQQMAEKLKHQEHIRVVFFMQNPSMWKYDYLYRLMAKSSRYEPIVVVVPYSVQTQYDQSEMASELSRAEQFAIQKGYRYILAYDFEGKKYVDIRAKVNPDIVFFSMPYKTANKHTYLYHYRDILTCYVQYGIACINTYKANYDLAFFNLLWRFFVETEYHKVDSQNHSFCRGENVEVVGSLGMEALVDPHYVPKDVWKAGNDGKKRIIWAPHHTVDYLFNFSNFLVYSDFMLTLAQKYKNKIQIAFKPHPFLRYKMFNIWGKEKTEAYYQRWQDMDNTQLEEGNYIDLFLTSDAMMHDCGSFTAEYLYTGKPVMFMQRDDKVLDTWTAFGRKCFDMHYAGRNEADIELFINNVVISGNDTMYDERTNFRNNTLVINDGLLPSERILKSINDFIS